MKVFYGIPKKTKFRNPVVAMGVFDGVHLAHQAILRSAAGKAHQIHGESIALTFWPHPQKEDSISSLEHRIRLIGKMGISACIVLEFTKSFSNISARDFVGKILIEKINPKYIYVGENFRFGKRARADYRFLKDFSTKNKFKVRVFKVIQIKHRAVSSTYIRKMITKGNLAQAQKLLARPVSVLGTVIRGFSLAKTLGFPTANIRAHHEVLPPSGIYAVRVVLRNKAYNGACYIGNKPTFISGSKPGAKHQHIEVHIFNFKKDIYAEYLEIQFIRKIREERKFHSLPLLTAQIRKDITFIKSLFSRHQI